MVGLAAHWMVGSIFSAGMGWIIIPTATDGWRMFLAVASLPAWCAAVGTWFMPESPRFLLVQGQKEAAEQVRGAYAFESQRRVHVIVT
jgi:MFS family permease